MIELLLITGPLAGGVAMPSELPPTMKQQMESYTISDNTWKHTVIRL